MRFSASKSRSFWPISSATVPSKTAVEAAAIAVGKIPNSPSVTESTPQAIDKSAKPCVIELASRLLLAVHFAKDYLNSADNGRRSS